PWWSPASAYSRYRSWDVLCFLEFSIVDEPHGQRAAGDCVPERIGERQGRAASEHLGHCNAVGQPLVIRRADGFECDPRLAEEFAVAAEAHLHRDLHARTRLIHGRRRPARSQRRYDVMKGVQWLVAGLRDRAGRRHGDRQRSTDEVSRGAHGWSRLPTRRRRSVGRQPRWAVRTDPPRYLASAATCTRVMRSGSTTGSPFLILSTTSMPERTSPTTVYLPLRKAPSAYMMKNCEFAEFGSFARA